MVAIAHGSSGIIGSEFNVAADLDQEQMPSVVIGRGERPSQL